MRARRSLLRDDDGMDPLGFLVNLFDVALVFALALMIALVNHLKMPDLLNGRDFTMVRDPGTARMEVITRRAGRVTRYAASSAPSTSAGEGRGVRVGTAYRLESGEIIYVPEDAPH